MHTALGVAWQKEPLQSSINNTDLNHLPYPLLAIPAAIRGPSFVKLSAMGMLVATPGMSVFNFLLNSLCKNHSIHL